MTIPTYRPQFKLISLLVLLLVGIGLIANPQPARAALSISGVSPNSILNNSAATLTVSGADFASGATVSLSGPASYALPTTFVYTTTLTAVAPAGLATGVYNVTVTNPDLSSATLNNGLQVNAPPATPTPTRPAGQSFERPVIVIQSYGASDSKIKFGQQFDLSVRVYNAGQKMAMNVVVTFLSSDAFSRETGGVIAIPQVAPDNRYDFAQPMTMGTDLWGKSSAAIEMNISYTDDQGNVYAEKFNLAIPISAPGYSAPTATSTPTLTPTPAPAQRPQLVITSYQADMVPLQPGVQFTLNLEISNLGTGPAKRVTMIVGGGSTISATSEPGGVPGGGGEFTNFAPLGASNVQSLGDLDMEAKLQAAQPLVVNVSTNPGAYPLKISFVYQNDRGSQVVDEQVITLLVYSLPNVEISFYRDPNPIFAGQMNVLPIQIVNLGRKSIVLGNMNVRTSTGQLTNNILLVGNLDMGGYFTLDANLMPDTAGPLDITVEVDYTDDFNQPRKIAKTLTVEVLESVQEGPIEPIPGEGEMPPPMVQEETFWQKVLRAILGLLGLDSARQSQAVQVEIPVTGPGNEGVPVKVLPPLKGP